MANQIANAAKARWGQWIRNVLDNSPANSAIVVVALQAAQADDDLRGYVTLSALLGNASNTEATFTNYARVVFTDSDALALTVDNANDRADGDMPDFTYTSAGGTVDNSLVKLVVCYDPDTTGGTDADLLIASHHDFVQATNGGDVQAQIDSAGFARAA